MYFSYLPSEISLWLLKPHCLMHSELLAELVLSLLFCKFCVAGLVTLFKMGEYLATILLFSAKDLCRKFKTTGRVEFNILIH